MKNLFKAKTPIIKCPHCGYEYLPCEIYLPGSFLGESDQIVRDALGKIIYEEYDPDNEPNMTEHYICDNCNKAFIIEAMVTYRTREEEEELDFSQEYTSLLD